ncbi:MAG: hypothetical protein JWO81_1390 [Alphaproteobacteria bacterium]|nr:hypothetical protein [Alphaproteobacteria bacterium]
MTLQWVDYHPWREEFEKALDPRFYRIEHLDTIINENWARIFTCPEAALIVELRRYPTGAFDGHVLIAAGSPKHVVAVLRPRAEAWLREIGAEGALVESRPGWARLLKDHGYAPHQMILRKDFARWT